MADIREPAVFSLPAGDEGNRTAEYGVFPGIRVIYRDVHSAPAPGAPVPGLLEIDHCREGRLAFRTGESVCCLAPGDLSIRRSGPEEAGFFPTGHFHGLTVQIDPAAAPESLADILEDVNVRPGALLQRFCGGGRACVLRSSPSLEHIFSEMYTVPARIRKGYLKIKVLELLLFLNAAEEAPGETARRLCTPSQVALAGAVSDYLSRDLQARYTIPQLADAFHVSPTQLKTCFRAVYGESVYSWARALKMQSAAQMLRRTDRTVMDIAGAHGYENASKFAGAFQAVYGVSPRAYRRAE